MACECVSMNKGKRFVKKIWGRVMNGYEWGLWLGRMIVGGLVVVCQGVCGFLFFFFFFRGCIFG